MVLRNIGMGIPEDCTGVVYAAGMIDSSTMFGFGSRMKREAGIRSGVGLVNVSGGGCGSLDDTWF